MGWLYNQLSCDINYDGKEMLQPSITRKMASEQPARERITAAQMLHLCGEATWASCEGQNEFLFRVTAWNLQPDEFGGATLDIVSVDHPSNYEIVMIDGRGDRILRQDLFQKFSAGRELTLTFNVNSQSVYCNVDGVFAVECCDFKKHTRADSPIRPSQGVGPLGRARRDTPAVVAVTP